MVIKYKAIIVNKPIRNNTDNTGFLLIITYIPKNIDINDMIYIKVGLEPRKLSPLRYSFMFIIYQNI